MSEAEYPTSSAFSQQTNYVNSTQVERASQMFSDSLDRHITKTETASYALVHLLESQAEKLELAKFYTCSQWGVAENSLVAIQNTATPLSALSELAKLLNLIQEMRLSNSNLNQQVMQLEQSLAESQNALQSQKVRSLNAESMLTQKTQEVAAAEAQVKHLFQELKAADQNAQRQQTQIDTLTAQFENSQERIAQMERECAFNQANYNEQSHQLRQTESDCRELRTRLARQQRQTLQLKVALEKCIEAPSSYQTEYSIQPDFSSLTSDSVKHSDSLLPKTQPISPWSAQPQALNDEFESDWTKFSASPFTPQSSSFDWSTEDLSTSLERELTALKNEAIASAETLPDQTFTQTTHEAASKSARQTCEEQQDAVTDLLIDQNPRTVKLPKVTTETVSHNTTEAEDAEWHEFVNHLLESIEEPATDDVVDKKTQLQPTESPQQGINSSTTNSNWPSPVVYPCHPPKKRKSLAAIELPKFS